MNMNNGTDKWKKIADDYSITTNESHSQSQRKSNDSAGRNDTLVS